MGARGDTSIVLEAAEGHEPLDSFTSSSSVTMCSMPKARRANRIDAFAETGVPMLDFGGGRGEFHSRLRSAAASVIDRHQPIDLPRDGLEERGLPLARAA
jgi:hypothetical protein